jgi:hypothetical protein
MNKNNWRKVEYEDLASREQAYVVIQPEREKGVRLFLDVVWDIELVFDHSQTANLIDLLDRATTLAEQPGAQWHELGSVAYAWCDMEMDGAGGPGGHLVVEASHTRVRLVVRLSPEERWSGDFVTELEAKKAQEFSALLREVASTSGR